MSQCGMNPHTTHFICAATDNHITTEGLNIILMAIRNPSRVSKNLRHVYVEECTFPTLVQLHTTHDPFTLPATLYAHTHARAHPRTAR